MKSIGMIRFLGIVSLLCGLLIVGVGLITKDRIKVNQDTILRDSLAQLLPGMTKELIYEIGDSDEILISTGQDTRRRRFFAGYDATGKFLGVVIEATERGYADTITAMYAYSLSSKSIIGFTVVESRETPGLGNRIGSDPGFLANFKRLETTHPISVVKHSTKANPWEIDAISGATISSRAIGRMLNTSLKELIPVMERNQQRIERGN